MVEGICNRDCFECPSPCRNAETRRSILPPRPDILQDLNQGRQIPKRKKFNAQGPKKVLGSFIRASIIIFCVSIHFISSFHSQHFRTTIFCQPKTAYNFYQLKERDNVCNEVVTNILPFSELKYETGLGHSWD